jgi:hypothetical protein
MPVMRRAFIPAGGREVIHAFLSGRFRSVAAETTCHSFFEKKGTIMSYTTEVSLTEGFSFLHFSSERLPYCGQYLAHSALIFITVDITGNFAHLLYAIKDYKLCD